jgi:uncharacterized protein
MKKTILHLLLLLVLPIAGMAQAKPVRIVFDITSNDSLAHQAVLRHVTGMSKSYPDSKFEVVIYGGALPMVVKNKSTVAKSIQQLGDNKNVSFKVCAVTMQRFAVDQSQLLPGTQVVPDAIMEIVTRQAEGWGYIKEAHH